MNRRAKSVEGIKGASIKWHAVDFEPHELFNNQTKTPEEVVMDVYRPWLNSLREQGLVWRNPRIELTPWEDFDTGVLYHGVTVIVETAPEEPLVLAEEIPDIPENERVGLKPRSLWLLGRLADVDDAIADAVAHLEPVPEEWNDEREMLIWVTSD